MRRRPTAPAACCRSCARPLGSCRRRATTSRTRRASSSRSASRPSAARRSSSTTISRAPFRASTTCICLPIWRMRRPRRRTPSVLTSSTSKPRWPRRHAPRSGSAANVSSRRSGSTRGSSLSVDRLLAIAMRELKATQEAFKTVASRKNGGDPLETWSRTKAEHPAPGELVDVGRQQLDELRTFLERQSVITLPPGEPITVAPTPDFYRWSFASMWTPGPVRNQADARLLLPDRRRPVVAGGSPARIPARLQLPDVVVDLDPRGLPRSLPALPAPAKGRVEGAQVDHVRAGVVRGRLGTLLRADDDRGRLRASGSEHQAGTAGRVADSPRALHRRNPPAHRGSLGRAGRPHVPRGGVPGRGERPARGRARHVRSDLSRLHRRKADDAQAAAGLPPAAGQGVFTQEFSRHAARARHRADLAASAVSCSAATKETCSSKR